MTRDEIIKAMDWHRPTVEAGPQSLLRRIERVVAVAEAQEREACAKVCEDDAFVDQWKGLAEAAKRIRARGQQPQPDTENNPSF